MSHSRQETIASKGINQTIDVSEVKARGISKSSVKAKVVGGAQILENEIKTVTLNIQRNARQYYIIMEEYTTLHEEYLGTKKKYDDHKYETLDVIKATNVQCQNIERTIKNLRVDVNTINIDNVDKVHTINVNRYFNITLNREMVTKSY